MKTLFLVLTFLISVHVNLQAQDCFGKIEEDPTAKKFEAQGKAYQHDYVVFALQAKYCACLVTMGQYKAIEEELQAAAKGILESREALPEIPTSANYRGECEPQSNDAIVKQATKNLIMVSGPAPQAKEVKASAEEPMTLESLGITKVPKYYALIIGVSKYQYAGPGLPNLDQPIKDAQKLADILVRDYYFDKNNVTLLKDATREQIINQFDKLAETLTDKDNLLIFYAGHGYYDKPKDFGYWLPADSKTSTRSSWIANSTIRDYMGAINSKHTLLISDACFGGSILKSRSVETTVQRFNEQYREPSRKAMTSGNLTVVSDNSVFIQFLLKTLENNKDVFLSTPLLFMRMYEPLMNNATSTPVFGPIQGAGDEGGEFIFIRRNGN